MLKTEPLDLMAVRLNKCLSSLAAEIDSETTAGHTNINKDAESIVRELMNILFGYSLKLEEKVNSSGFDLCDRDSMRFVQVTSDQSTTKIQDCLRTTTDRVIADPTLRDFDLDIIFLTTNSKKTETLKQKIAKKLPYPDSDLSLFGFDPAENLLDFNNLLAPLRENHVDLNQMTQLSDLMDKYWPHIASQPAVTDRVQEIIKQYADNFTAPLFLHRDSTTVTLQNMYVEPSFDDAGDLAHQFGTVSDCIHDFLWNKSREKIMVIEGDAAIGKTSLVSWMCYHAQAGDEEAQKLFRESPVVCVRLRELEFEENEESADPILRYLNIPDAREFVRRYPNAILILDGADELGMVSSLNASRIGQFILNSCNSLAVRKLIVTSRPQILDVSHLKTILFDTRKITLTPFPSYKRAEWINKYLALGETVSQETLNYIDSLTDQEADGVANTPLALYLLVQCEFQEDFRNNLWALYHEIFSEAIMQTYYNSPVLGTTPVLSQEEAKLNYAMVKEIAYTMFRNSGYDRFHITRQELDECAKAVGLEGADAERVKQTCVLCAYWKNSTDGALEFYHNNIRDFFLCEYICDQILEVVREMPDDLGLSQKNTYPYQVFPRDECMDSRWAPLIELCCSILSWTTISLSTWKRVFQMIALRLSAESKQPDNSHTLYAYFLRKPILLQLPNALLSAPTMWSTAYSDHPYTIVKYIVANVVALWHVFMPILAPNLRESHRRFHYTINCTFIFKDWHELFQERIDLSPFGYVSLLSYTDFFAAMWNNLILQQADFAHSTLAHTSLNGSVLRGANFSNCVMDEVNFRNAHLRGCVFKYTNIEDCFFNKNTQVEASSFSYSSLRSSSFGASKLKSLQISSTKFLDCDFNAASMFEILCDNVLYNECEFFDTCIENSIFQTTAFENCTFADITFKNVTLENCQFTNCTFNDATAHNCTYRNVDPETAAQLEAIGFTEDTTERIF